MISMANSYTRGNTDDVQNDTMKSEKISAHAYSIQNV